MGTVQDPAVFLATQRASLALFVAAQVYGVPLAEMRAPTRGRPHAARARQIAVHLAAKVFGMSHRQLAREFGRDRSTVCHACRRVAAMRAGSPEFHATLCWMESLLMQAAGRAAA